MVFTAKFIDFGDLRLFFLNQICIPAPMVYVLCVFLLEEVPGFLSPKTGLKFSTEKHTRNCRRIKYSSAPNLGCMLVLAICDPVLLSDLVCGRE